MPKANRDKGGTFPSFAYTQTIVRLYPNDRVPIPDFKRKISVKICYRFLFSLRKSIHLLSFFIL